MVKMGKESAILLILNPQLNQCKHDEFPGKNKTQYMKKNIQSFNDYLE